MVQTISEGHDSRKDEPLQRQTKRDGCRERAFPHFVDMVVPEGGLGNRLDAMYERHRACGIEDKHGRGRYDKGRHYVRWCFPDPEIAAAFANAFGR